MNEFTIKTTFPPVWWSSLLIYTLFPFEWILIKSIVKHKDAQVGFFVLYNILIEVLFIVFDSRYFLTPRVQNQKMNNHTILNKIENCLLISNAAFLLMKIKTCNALIPMMSCIAWEWYSRKLIRSPYDLLLMKGINNSLRAISFNWGLLGFW